MPNRLGLKDWNVTNAEESTTDMRVTAEYTPPPSVCPRCGLADPPICRHDVRIQHFADIPRRGKPFVITVKRQRFLCRSCGLTFQEHLPGMDDKHVMTKRLTDYIRASYPGKRFAEIAREVGLHEKTIRNVVRGA